MNRTHIRTAVCAIFVLCGIPFAALSSPTQTDLLLQSMQRELKRATTSLAKTDPQPYYLSYTVTDGTNATILGTSGSLVISTTQHRRQADVMMRVGTAALDNTHSQSRPTGITSGVLPLRDDPDAVSRMLWLLTDREYEQASAAFLRVKTNQAVQSAEEDKSPDFSQESPQTFTGPDSAKVPENLKPWEDRVRHVSARFLKYPEVYGSLVVMSDGSGRSYIANSEGAALEQSSASARLVIQGESRADDGMDLVRVETFQEPSPDQLPSEAELIAKVDKIAADLKALRAAPSAEPYVGPAMLSGRAAAVFFHEVLGHRLEGHRQRDEREGQTFTKKVGQQILPPFLTVVDDPTTHVLNGTKLAGSYAYDDEGVPAQKVVAVDNGVLKNFLMSRMPITNFDHSNGHGRRQPGLMPTGRQGNLIVTSTNTVKDSELRQKFIEEIKKQGKPYGLVLRGYSGRIHAHHARAAAGVSGDSRDGVARLSRRPSG